MIFALDPSLKCTGYAVLSDDGERFIEAGTITDDCPDEADAYLRAKSITEQAEKVLERFVDDVSVVVVESPQTLSRGMGGKRSASTAPNYGIIVGVATHSMDDLSVIHGFTLLRPSATLWTAGLPGTARDKHKEKRACLVRQVYGLEAGALGCKTKAGNAADAVLLARWAAGQKCARNERDRRLSGGDE